MFQFEKNALDNFLKGLDYPVSKENILELAKDRELPLQIISMLQRLSGDHEFSSPQEIENELTIKAK